MSRLWKIGARHLIAGALLIASTLASLPAQAQQPLAQGQPDQVSGDVRAVLAQYGSFVQHQRYGEVWIPSVTPPNWHPYPPCHWVNSRQYSWYYDDKTPWGAIVHHYGRWTYEDTVGWFWVPGAEFGPGWVMWRTSPQWVGWAPTPPDEDVQNGSPDQFNNANYWIFMDAAKFAQGCNETTVVAGPRSLQLVRQTTVVREVEIVNGILVFVLPSYVMGPIIDIVVVFDPWPAWYFAQVLLDWNWFWNNVGVVLALDCPQPIVAPMAKPPSPPPSPPSSGPPSPPPTNIVGPPPGPPPPLRCADGSYADAYGNCRTVIIHECGTGFVARGNFCLPIQGSDCRANERRVDGRCIPIDTGQDCKANERRVDGRCVPITVGQNCGMNAQLVNGRCVPNGPILTHVDDKPPVIRRPGDGCTVAAGCQLNHPTATDGSRPRPTTQGNLPNLTTSGPNKTFVPKTTSSSTTSTSGSGGTYVMGRGSAGHNVFNAGAGSGGGTGRPSGAATAGPARISAPPILHAMPQKGAVLR